MYSISYDWFAVLKVKMSAFKAVSATLTTKNLSTKTNDFKVRVANLWDWLAAIRPV